MFDQLRRTLQLSKKQRIFGCCGAGGSLLGALVGEVPHNVLWNMALTHKNVWVALLTSAIWVLILAVGIGPALVIGQNRYLRRRLLSIREALAAVPRSAVAGFVAGAVAEFLFQILQKVAYAREPGRIVAWAIFGALLAQGIVAFVPNLTLRRAAFGGSLGGALGAVGFIATCATLGEPADRFVGAAILGLFIGLMIATAEEFARNAWLVIRWAPKEETTLSLGASPVVLGSSPEAHIYLRNDQGYPPVAATVALINGKIEFENKMTGQKQTLVSGNKLKIGQLVVEVCTS